jgi:hypothetical protein
VSVATSPDFLEALAREGFAAHEAKNILRDARATLRHGPGSTSCARLLRSLKPGMTAEVGRKPAIVCADGRRIQIPEDGA